MTYTCSSTLPSWLFYSSQEVGKEAEILKNDASRYEEELNQPLSTGPAKETVLKSLEEILHECQHEGWDGYGATAVLEESVSKAVNFLELFQPGLQMPEVSADPDGEISFEWFKATDRVFSISVGTNGELSYAGIFGPNKTHGVEIFKDQIPKVIFDNLNRLEQRY